MKSGWYLITKGDLNDSSVNVISQNGFTLKLHDSNVWIPKLSEIIETPFSSLRETFIDTYRAFSYDNLGPIMDRFQLYTARFIKDDSEITSQNLIKTCSGSSYIHVMWRRFIKGSIVRMHFKRTPNSTFVDEYNDYSSQYSVLWRTFRKCIICDYVVISVPGYKDDSIQNQCLSIGLEKFELPESCQYFSSNPNFITRNYTVTRDILNLLNLVEIPYHVLFDTKVAEKDFLFQKDNFGYF